eukprot:CAMPEP_0172625358 /NCGR_PEP_ID=MMETSP1068-20121228/143307_1 /TAXON_ID=35684 /ORGANISM="Pseudopedinella elastica, Strain CCMP716" /LENGTH=108 /DNA_ID=CAMNT_0013434623 /DNA_START=74 /DNA_END=397 /DNA_ORIENTATION=-
MAGNDQSATAPTAPGRLEMRIHDVGEQNSRFEVSGEGSSGPGSPTTIDELLYDIGRKRVKTRCCTWTFACCGQYSLYFIFVTAMIASIVALCNRRQIIYTTETTSDYY